MFDMLKKPLPKQHVAVYPDGTRFVIRRKNGAWWWSESAGSSPLSAAIEQVEARGGKVIYERPAPIRRP